MNIILGGRGTGKTVKLIELSIHLNAYILVSDYRRAVNIKTMAAELGYPQLLCPITYREFFDHRNTGYVKKLLIDDADDVISHMASVQGWTLEAMTMNKDDKKLFYLPDLPTKRPEFLEKEMIIPRSEDERE